MPLRVGRAIRADPGGSGRIGRREPQGGPQVGGGGPALLPPCLPQGASVPSTSLGEATMYLCIYIYIQHVYIYIYVLIFNIYIYVYVWSGPPAHELPFLLSSWVGAKHTYIYIYLGVSFGGTPNFG